jgi:hypothetical protein
MSSLPDYEVHSKRGLRRCKRAITRLQDEYHLYLNPSTRADYVRRLSEDEEKALVNDLCFLNTLKQAVDDAEKRENFATFLSIQQDIERILANTGYTPAPFHDSDEDV